MAEAADSNPISGQPPLVLLVETIEDLSTARTVEDVAAIIRVRARRISRADGVTFVLRDGDCCHYLDEDAVGPLWKGRRFPMTQCISGRAMSAASVGWPTSPRAYGMSCAPRSRSVSSPDE